MTLGLMILAMSNTPDAPKSPPAASTHLLPGDAVERLREGNERFVAGTPRHPNTGPERLRQIASEGQHPFATVLTCSDSRVSVTRLFDQGFGDVFVVRVAGNVCAVDEIASIEYSVDHLNTPLVVVLGHTHCGAVTAATEGGPPHGHIASLLAHIRPAVEAARRKHPGVKGADLIPAAIEANVWQAIGDLLHGSRAVRERVAAGRLLVAGAICDLATGRVEWLGEHPEQARLLNDAGAPTGQPSPISAPSSDATAPAVPRRSRASNTGTASKSHRDHHARTRRRAWCTACPSRPRTKDWPTSWRR